MSSYNGGGFGKLTMHTYKTPIQNPTSKGVTNQELCQPIVPEDVTSSNGHASFHDFSPECEVFPLEPETSDEVIPKNPPKEPILTVDGESDGAIYNTNNNGNIRNKKWATFESPTDEFKELIHSEGPQNGPGTPFTSRDNPNIQCQLNILHEGKNADNASEGHTTNNFIPPNEPIPRPIPGRSAPTPPRKCVALQLNGPVTYSHHGIPQDSFAFYDDASVGVCYDSIAIENYGEPPLNPLLHSTVERNNHDFGDSHNNPFLDAPFIPGYNEEEDVELPYHPTKKRSLSSYCHAYILILERVVKFAIVVISLTTITISIYVIHGCKQNDAEPKAWDPTNGVIRMPCTNLSELFPVAGLHQDTDAITNERFKMAEIQRRQTKDGTICELPKRSMLRRMTSQRGTHLVEGQVDLTAANRGPEREYSYYNLSITEAKVNNLKADRFSLIIQHEGLYFVYFGLHLTYGMSDDMARCRDLHFKTSVTHLIRKRHDSTEPQLHRALLRSEHTCCLKCAEESSTDFTGGMFHLVKGDELFIQVSAPKAIGSDGQNFLGMFQLKRTNSSTEQ